jgi:hypothetical protein
MPSSGMLRSVALVRTGVPPKCWYLEEPHGITFQKTAFFILDAVKPPRYTNMITFCYTIELKTKSLTSEVKESCYRIRNFNIKKLLNIKKMGEKSPYKLFHYRYIGVNKRASNMQFPTLYFKKGIKHSSI